MRETWAVLGAGSWGTVLALHLARAGHRALLWTHRAQHYRTMVAAGANERYVPGVAFPPSLTPTSDLAAAVAAAAQVLVVVPSAAFRRVVHELQGLVAPPQGVVWGTKGFEPGSRKLLHQVVREELGDAIPLAAMSGPTFAREVAADLPTCITVASPDADFADRVARAIQTDHLLPFTSDDLVGVQIGGATKNVIAIAAGAADGMALGSNARAALMTRGLHEIVRLGTAMGAREETLVGLAGLGDLVLTCSDDQSRNRRFGLALGSGMDVDAARASIGQVVEGIATALTVHALAREAGVALPICDEVHAVVHEGRSAAEAVHALLQRRPGPEVDPAAR